MSDTNAFSNGNSSDDTRDFIKQIEVQLSEGYGFVPFIGAGFSAPSGAPLVHELQEYLQRCICISLGVDMVDTSTDIEPWNPRTDQWPPFIDRKHVRDSGDWIKLLFEKIEATRKDDSEAWCQPEVKLLSEGYGAMQDWRTALLFLSRLTRGRRGTEEAKTVRLGVPQQEVIDACFRQVLKRKFPALGHRMLAALAGAMRLDVILTTNFDNLLEQAFEVARNPLEVFEVQREGKLPNWATLSNVRALVKLHGGRESLRVDYSLDERPSEEDKQTFLHYLLSPKGRNDYSRDPSGMKGKLDFQNHLLVIGFSATDIRIRAFIEHAWEYLRPEFRVYWICHTENDVKNISKFICDSEKLISGKKIKQTGELTALCKTTILQHTQAGLFLLQLYQTLRKTLPPLGSIFPSIARLTFPPLEPAWITKNLEGQGRIVTFKENIKNTLDALDALDNKLNADQNKHHKVIVASSDPESSGFISACARTFRYLEEKGRACLWIDMNDVSSAENLFEALLEGIYYRLGLEDWISPTVGYSTSKLDNTVNPEDHRAKHIKHLICSVNKRWVIFLNGYETPGANTSRVKQTSLNGWLDTIEAADPTQSSQFDDNSASAQRLRHLLHTLCGHGSRISVILIYRQPDAERRSKFSSHVQKNSLKNVRGFPNENTWGIRVELEELDSPQHFIDEAEVVNKALEWVEKDVEDVKAKRRFLHALVLMQRPRHLATLWSSALLLEDLPQPAERQREQAEKQVKWIEDLEAKDVGLVRRKLGGLIWIYSRCRQMLRDILMGDKKALANLPRATQVSISEWQPRSKEAEIHTKIAEWYERVLDASEAPAAAFEATYHFCRAGWAFLRPEKCEYGRARASVDAATALLRSNSFLIQTHGYSRGSCRRLILIAGEGTEIYKRIQQIKDQGTSNNDVEAVEEAVRSLWIVCAEVMRAVAREVGEDAKANYRNRQVGRLLAGKKTKDPEETWDKACTDDPSKSISGELKELYEQNSIELLRWRRWCGMLAIASRSYDQAQPIFEKTLGVFSAQKDYQKSPETFESQTQRIEFLRMMEQSVELMLLQAMLIRRQAKLGNISNKNLHELEKVLNNADHMINRAMKLARKIHASDPSSDARDTILANWCETRLLMHRSVVECQRKSLDLPLSQVLDAMGILSDAEAKTRMADARRARSELALIDLHRADAKLCEADSIKLSLSTNIAEFPMPLLIDNLEKHKSNFNKCKNSKNRVALAQANALTCARALVEDSLRFLDRAEPVLRDRRRNVWWTTWFFERKMRAIALSVTISVFEGGTPIPFLGLEAAMRSTETEAERLLEDTIRMVRVDAYRLATVIEAYISCYKALEMRLHVNEPIDIHNIKSGEDTPLPNRRERMRTKIAEAHSALVEVFNHRTKPPGGFNKKRGKLDPEVEKYVKKVIKKAAGF